MIGLYIECMQARLWGQKSFSEQQKKNVLKKQNFYFWNAKHFEW